MSISAAAPPPSPRRRLRSGQVSRLLVVDCDGGAMRTVIETPRLIEAPNWTPDGRLMIVNGEGALFGVAADGSGGLERIDTGIARDLNNDHVLSADGRTIYLSSDDGHLYAMALAGGAARRVSNEHPPVRRFRYYLHGVSPDERTLAYVGVEAAPAEAGVSSLKNVFTIPAAGGPDRQLTFGAAPHDGPEFSPDGAWLYFNAAPDAATPEHRLWRMRPDGGGRECIFVDARSNWFPHLSPDGRLMCWLSYPPGTSGHPPDRDVILRVAAADGGAARDVAAFNGGQGTINVNSWAPDGRRFACVAYPPG